MPHADLLHHAETQFPKGLVDLAPGIWGAIGFAASNVYAVEGTNSLTIIDTSESTGAAKEILAAFRERSDKPIARIIYTHSHRDHICGASVFAGEHDIPILASSGFKSDLIGVSESQISPIQALGRRTRAQFGIGLPAEDRVSLGCGPGNRPMEGLGAGYIAPNRLIDEECEFDLDGIAARFIMAPGETADHMVVWLPEQKVLFSGDNWYHAFPNLYAIRGTAYRDFVTWADSLETLAELDALILAPGHTMPVRGRESVREVLTSTCAAIRYVMTATADKMNAGASLDDIMAQVRLPDTLQEKSWLGEYYGKVGWSARAYAVGTLGWYDGNPTNLGCLSSRERASEMAELAGGEDALFEAAKSASNLQWRLELCDHLIALGKPAEKLKAETLKMLAETEINATARNTYLSEAAKLSSKQVAAP